jgi:hypothetical protein
MSGVADDNSRTKYISLLHPCKLLAVDDRTKAAGQTWLRRRCCADDARVILRALDDQLMGLLVFSVVVWRGGGTTTAHGIGSRREER